MSDLGVEPIPSDPDNRSGSVQVRIDSPGRRNALTLETVQHLHDLLRADDSSTILLGSTTPGIFSAGADLDVDDVTRTRLSDLLYACYEQMVSRPGVVIAVVEGAAVGGGAQLTAAADLRLISSEARWRWVGPGHGLAVGAWILPELVGRSRALDLTLTSRWLHAPEAVAAGLAPRIDEAPWVHALALAAELGRADARALARVKQIATTPGVRDSLRAEREQNRRAWSGQAPSARQSAAEGRARG